MEIEFDPSKDKINRRKHGIGLAAAAPIFSDFRIDYEDLAEDYDETRYITLGRISARTVVVCVWTPRGAKARIISLRKADKDEREIYRFHRP